jgi:hypothetical protein
MSKELIELMSRTSEIKIINEHRRCDIDTSGLELPNGRDHYGLWNWYVDDETNEWPGFWNPEDCINDMINKCNHEQ